MSSPEAVETAARQVEAALLEAGGAAIPDEASQRLLAAALRLYVAKLAAAPDLAPFPPGSPVTGTDVAVATIRMLKAVEMELFELGLWQSMGIS